MNIFYRCKYTKKNIGVFKKNGNKKAEAVMASALKSR